MINNIILRNFRGNSLYRVISQGMAYHKGPGKSIYNKKKFTNPDFNENNTIDITDASINIEKEFNFNLNMEMKINEKNASEKKTKKEDVKVKTFQNHEDLQQEIKNMKEFDYDIFKKRNNELSQKDKKKKEVKEIETEEDIDEEEKQGFIDESTLAKLKEIIKEGEAKDEKENFKSFNKEEEEENKFNGEYMEEKNVLVHRPLKNFVWGLGQQTKQKKFKFVPGEHPTVEAIVNYLEVNNMKEILVIPTHKLGLIHLKENNIICSGHTSRHIYKTAKDLVVEIKKLNIPNLPFIPTVFGRRDEEWIIIEIGDIQIHLFQESFRKEIDLLDRWVNPPPEDFVEWQRRVEHMFYGRKK